MRRHFQQFPPERTVLKTQNPDQQHHSFLGPIEALSSVNSPQQASVSYKKASQTATIALANANRYSYMMAVNTHPVAIKEHRL